MAAFNKFNIFLGDLGAKKHDLTADALKIMLTDTAPVATNTVKANIAEIAAGNGYATGGNAAAFVSWTQVAGLWKLVLSPVQFTADRRQHRAIPVCRSLQFDGRGRSADRLVGLFGRNQPDERQQLHGAARRRQRRIHERIKVMAARELLNACRFTPSGAVRRTGPFRRR